MTKNQMSIYTVNKTLQQTTFMLQKLIKDLPLTDAHRHSLYDIEKISDIEGTPVERWHSSLEFITYQHKTKSLFGANLLSEIKEWLDFSISEGIKTILDYSGKHARRDLENIYSSRGIKSFSPIKWTMLDKQSIGHPKPSVVILPDERLIDDNILEKAKEYRAKNPNIKFTMHCLESQERLLIAHNKFGMSTVEWLRKQSFLDENLLLVHLNEVTISDIEIIRDARVKIVLCPLMRKPLNNKSPHIPIDLPLYFGTDAPLISGSRSLITAAAQQVCDWVAQGINFESALSSALNGLTHKL